MNPIAYHARLHRWSFFVTLTYRSKDEHGNPMNVPPWQVRRSMLFAFLRRVAKGEYRDRSSGKRAHSIRFKDLLWLAREERGEKGDRYHYHVLIDGLPIQRCNKTEAFVFHSMWADLGGGHVDSRLFNPELPGVDYCFEGLDGWSHAQANAYEMGKFNENTEQDRILILSQSCSLVWGIGLQYREGGREATSNAAYAGTSPVGRRKMTPEQRMREGLRLQAAMRFERLSMHPAGPSFLR